MAIQLQNLSLGIGRFQRGPISFEFPDRGLFLLVGPNGSGKTTLLRTLVHRLPPLSGAVHGLKFPVGVSGAESLLMREWTVGRNWEFLSALRRNETTSFAFPEEMRAHRDIPSHHLSQGTRRKVELSMLMALGFPTLLLDEPLAPLDQASRVQYAAALQKYAEEHLVILSTHESDTNLWPSSVKKFSMETLS